jgi:LysR family transcriptional regulator, glycine cleavage system transcriptional activator
MGLALVPRCLVAEDVATGVVSAPLRDGYIDDLGYWLCYPESRAQVAALTSFREWLHAEVGAAT